MSAVELWERAPATRSVSVDPEEATHQHLAELFARMRPECVLDVGANAGQYAERLRGHGYRGWIVSFEPIRSVFEELAERAERDERWRTFNFALGAANETRQLGVASVSQLSSFRRSNRYAAKEFPGASEVEHAERVEIRTLNDCWAQCLAEVPQNRVFLKLDTQGWDLEVLKGASQVLDALAGVQLEASVMPIYDQVPSLTETLAATSELGLDLSGIFAVNADSLFRLIEVDCVFINSHHHDAESWREETWAMLSNRFREEVAAALPPGSSFALIDDTTLGMDELAGRRAIPFLERDGEYYGAPDEGEEAVTELIRQTEGGVRHVAVAWPSFWWLEEYPELAEHLDADWRRILETDVAIVFELGQ